MNNYSVEDTYEDEKNHCTIHAICFIVTSHDRCVPVSLLAITVTILNSKQQNKGDLGRAYVFLKENKVGEMPCGHEAQGASNAIFLPKTEEPIHSSPHIS